MSERIRLTITVTPEVHEVFSRMAEAGGMSLGKCMGEWLADTIDGAQFVAQKMQEARKAPRTVMRELQAFSRGLVDEMDDAAEKLRRSAVSPEATPRAGAAFPPPSNTGGNPPGKTPSSPKKAPK